MTLSQPHHIRIFLSSPGDVGDERALALQVLEALPYDPLLRGKITVEAVAWDKPDAGTPMLASMTPQEAINQGLLKPSECDIVVVILWSRMGTPLPPEYTKLDGSRYQSGTEWEFIDAVTASRQSKQIPSRPQVVVYRSRERIAVDADDPERAAKLEQWERVKRFFAGFVNPDGSILTGVNSYNSPEEFRQQFERHLKVLIGRFLEASPLAATPAAEAVEVSLWKGSPFPGLRAFTPDDAPIFFGRGIETDSLLRRIKAQRLVAVVGASGSGKSSLVGAGLIPRLIGNAIEGSKDWLVPGQRDEGEKRVWAGLRFTPGEVGSDPFMALAVRLAPMVGHTPRDIADELVKQPESIVTLTAALFDGKPEWAQALLFIDQFEELFTLVHPQQVPGFIALLEAVAHSKRLRIVLTMRADFYARSVEYPALATLLNDSTYPLATPGTTELFQMIERPAAWAGLSFEDGLVNRILKDTGTDPGALALMAFALDELYNARANGQQLTVAAYESFGGVQGAIGERAETLYAALNPAAQSALFGVFRELIEVDERGEATRRRVVLSLIAPNPTALDLVSRLTDGRLLVQTLGADGQPSVEVAHEALLYKWPRLAEWIGAVREDLFLLGGVRQAASEWERQMRSTAYLWPHERLLLVYDMTKRLQPLLSESEKEFIRPEVERILDELQNADVTPYRRAAYGERISVLGESRIGVGLHPDGIPHIDWCQIFGGEICVVSEIEQIAPFYISRYTVTYSQFQAFLLARDGYGNPSWWVGLASHSSTPEDPLVKFDNHPRCYVSWFEAVAFCRWLTAKHSSETVPTGYELIRLPTEAEWQIATSLEPHKYPWGDNWEPYFANTRETGVGKLVAVGMFPQGISPSGIYDLSGNVWEWTLTNFDSGDTDFGGSDERIMRGGSWRDSHLSARCISRQWKDPDYRADNVGFRVVAVRNM